jgi:hypothetical protein
LCRLRFGVLDRMKSYNTLNVHAGRPRVFWVRMTALVEEFSAVGCHDRFWIFAGAAEGAVNHGGFIVKLFGFRSVTAYKAIRHPRRGLWEVSGGKILTQVASSPCQRTRISEYTGGTGP